MNKEITIREQLETELGKPFMPILGYLQGIFILLLISSAFIAIWGSFSIAWKLCLTGFLGVIICYFLYNALKKAISSAVDSELKSRSLK